METKKVGISPGCVLVRAESSEHARALETASAIETYDALPISALSFDSTESAHG